MININHIMAIRIDTQEGSEKDYRPFTNGGGVELTYYLSFQRGLMHRLLW